MSRPKTKVPTFAPRYNARHMRKASRTRPMAIHLRDQMVRLMRAGLRAFAEDRATPEDWRVCSDPINLLETMVEQKWLADAEGLLVDAVNALGAAGARNMKGEPLRLDADGLAAVTHAVDDYEEMLGHLSEFDVLLAINITERRIHAILHGRQRDGDVEVTAL